MSNPITKKVGSSAWLLASRRNRVGRSTPPLSLASQGNTLAGFVTVASESPQREPHRQRKERLQIRQLPNQSCAKPLLVRSASAPLDRQRLRDARLATRNIAWRPRALAGQVLSAKRIPPRSHGCGALQPGSPERYDEVQLRGRPVGSVWAKQSYHSPPREAGPNTARSRNDRP